MADETLTRKKAVDILNSVHSSYQGPLNQLFRFYESNNCIDQQSSSLWNTLLQFRAKTERSVTKELQRRNLLVPFLPYILDSRDYAAYSPTNIVELKKFFHIMYICDMRAMFEKLFQLPNLLNEILNYIDELDGCDWIFNVTQTKHWAGIVNEMNLQNDEVAIPLYIFFDDFEPLNVLGSHSGVYKLGGVYVYIPCVPPEAQAKLQFIFLGMLFFSNDRSSYGNNRVFSPFIDALNVLQTDGVPITHHLYSKVKLVPVSLIGDNLGLNSVMGFVECFVAHHYCRICRSHKNEMSYQIEENSATLRNSENYDTDCELGNPTLTGIKERSVWNKLHNFHVVQNISVDIAHDLYEGALDIVITEILKRFINELNYFTLATFNDRMKKHNFGPIERNTNLAPITEEMLQKCSIRASASEMLTLFSHFAFIIGDLVRDKDRPEWKVYLLMKEVVTIVRQKCVHKDTKFLLRKLIAEHHELFLKTFNRSLTPKMHFMIHYPDILNSMGPICALATLRFESFHTIFKSIVKNLKCRKNIVKSCSYKMQMRLANLFLNFESFHVALKTYKRMKLSSAKILQKYRSEMSLSDFVHTTKFVQINAATFKTGYVIQVGKERDETPKFALIIEMIINENEVLLGCQKLITLGYDKHFHAFVVEKDDFFYLKTINWKYTKASYIFIDKYTRNLVMWE